MGDREGGRRCGELNSSQCGVINLERMWRVVKEETLPPQLLPQGLLVHTGKLNTEISHTSVACLYKCKVFDMATKTSRPTPSPTERPGKHAVTGSPDSHQQHQSYGTFCADMLQH